MRNIGLLIKNYLNCFLGRFSKNKTQTKRTIGALGIILIVGLISITMFISLAISIVQSSIDSGNPVFALYINATMALIFILIMVVTKSSVSNKNVDDEMLMSLPIRKSHIVIAKLFYDYLFDFSIVFIIVIPSYIVYYIYVPDVSLFLIVRAFIVCMLLPLLLGTISYFIGLLFNVITRKFKYSNLLKSILNIVLLLAFLISYYGLLMITDDNSIKYANIIMNLAPIEWMVDFISLGHIKSFGFIVLCTVLPFVLCVVLKSYFLGKSFSSYKNKKTSLSFKQLSPLKSLYKREMSRYFNSAIYVINTLFGGVMILIFAGILVALGKDYIIRVIENVGLNSFDRYIIGVILIIINFSVSAICTTSCSISLEAKTLWILKSHPVSEKNIFISKILFNLTISLPFIFIGGILLSISIGFKYAIFIILIPAIFSFCVSTIGLIVNLLYPKFDWSNEMTVIKQSLSVGVSMAVNMIIGIVPMIIFFLFNKVLNEIILLIIVLFIYIIISVICYIFLFKKGKKIFDKLFD